MKKLLFFSLTICLFISCNNNKKGIHGIGNEDKGGGGSSWSKQDRNKWMDVCEKGFGGNAQGKQICSCVLEKMEKKYEDYAEADQKGTEEEGKKLATQCWNEMNKGGGGGDDDYTDDNNGKKKAEDNGDDDYTDDGGNGNGGWSKTEKNKFMTDCIQSTGNYGNGKQLCSCVLEKLEKKYSSLNEADRKGVEAAKRFSQECLGNSGEDSYDNN